MRPDWGLVGWLLKRPDRQSLLIVGRHRWFPLVVGASRLAFVTAGLTEAAALTLSAAVGTGLVGLIAFG